MSTTGSSSSGSSGNRGVAAASKSSYVDVVRRVAVADHHDVLEADGLAHLVDDGREERVGEAHFVPESPRMYSSSFGASRRLSGLITPAPRNAAW